MSSTPTLRVWLAALLPLLPVVLALAVQPVPSSSDGSLCVLDGSTPGAWRMAADDGVDERAAARDFDDCAWQPYQVPGPVPVGNVNHAWMRRSFAPPSSTHGSGGGDLFLMVPNIGGAARVYVNGTLIGEKGVPNGRYLDMERLDGFTVPRALLRDDASNVLALELFYAQKNDGIADRRFILGPPQIVKGYLERNVSMKALLGNGAMMVTLFGFALVFYLYGRGGDRALYRSSLFVMVDVFVYLTCKTGIVIGYVLETSQVQAVLLYSVIGIALTTPELIESYYVGRVTWFRKINRVVSSAWLLAALIFGIGRAYAPGTIWLFVVIVHALIFAGRDLFRPRTAYGPVLAMAVAVTAGTGAADLLTDRNLFYLPRLFSYGVGNLAVIAVVLAFADLLRLGRELREKNAALQDALARAEETSRLKSEFLANTSHELRTPLNAIINIPQGLLAQIEERSVVSCSACGVLFEPTDDGIDDVPCPSCDARGSLSLQVRRFPPDDGDALSLHLRSIIGSGEHLLAVVNDILDFSKLNAGRMKIEKERLGVAGAIARAFSTVSPAARTGTVALVSRVDPALEVNADPTRFVQVLINLIANAVKFSPPGASVDVEAVRAGNDVVVRVIDRGVGIAAEHHATIFESFRQVEAGHTRKHGGTGLGLAIVKQIVDMHGGAVSVESELGKGATFTVRLS
ncbi:MAG TPA: HAMP domain-containing sensor histidine kinase [Myxococcota bacterium]